MGETKENLWEVEPHTIAKLSILETYTIAWANVLAYQSAKFKGDQEYLLIVDGFAGQGKLISKRDRKICDGSPILAVKTISGLTNKLPKPVKFLFIEATEKCPQH
jgi:three-Cys-motif partner protein